MHKTDKMYLIRKIKTKRNCALNIVYLFFLCLGPNQKVCIKKKAKSQNPKQQLKKPIMKRIKKTKQTCLTLKEYQNQRVIRRKTTFIYIHTNSVTRTIHTNKLLNKTRKRGYKLPG